MPLYKGEQNIGKNYQKLIGEGYSKKQATAIAIKVAGRKKRDKKREKKKHG
jgi:hypothetical protein